MATNTILLSIVAVITLMVVNSKGFPAADSHYSSKNCRPDGSNLQWIFSVELDEPLKPSEQILITGDPDFLGAWSPNKALILNITDNPVRWSGSVGFPANLIVKYRFFIGTVGSMQIRLWETSLDGRTVNLGCQNFITTDRFGIVGNKKEVNRGWLNCGEDVQFKLFRNPIKLYKQIPDQRIYVKVQPLENDLVTPIMSSARANVKFARMQYGLSEMRDQPTYGAAYDRNDIVVFDITTDNIKNLAFKIILNIRDEKDLEKVRPIGHQYLYPEAIDGSEGSIELEIISEDSGDSIGTIQIGYLVMQPLPTQLNFATGAKYYWNDDWTALDVGHRGLGISFEPAPEASPVTENTVESMKQAGKLGADMIETDTQLTKDLIPIIYHNFFVYLSKNKNKKPTTEDDLTQVLIKNLTYKELKNSTIYQIIDSKVKEFPSHDNQPQRSLRLFPRLEDFLTELDHNIGMDLEIKWPQALRNGDLESHQTIDKNVFVDRIVDVLLQKGCSRVIFISSLDSDICTMINYKQNIYPVMCLGPEKTYFYADPRSDNLVQTINNAQAMGYKGVVPHDSYYMKNGARQVRMATDLNLKNFIWGSASNSTQMVDYFKSLGATGVIYDRMDKILPAGKRNKVAQEQDIPEFYRDQCLYKKF